MSIAIDGPAGAGKSTVARELAKILGIKYLDTGAMYRAITLKVLRGGICLHNTDEIQKLLDTTDLEIISGEDGTTVYMDGEDVTTEIRTPTVSNNVSQVSCIRQVRNSMVKLQQGLMRRWGDVVLDGRDIGTIVMPDARYKFFLDATVQERAFRRWKELRDKGREMPLPEVRKEILMRDRIDTERDESPLRVAPGAIVIDSTDLPLESVIKKILEYIK